MNTHPTVHLVKERPHWDRAFQQSEAPFDPPRAGVRPDDRLGVPFRPGGNQHAFTRSCQALLEGVLVEGPLERLGIFVERPLEGQTGWRAD